VRAGGLRDNLHNKVAEFRKQAATCEEWASTISYPELRQAFVNLATQWREMAGRLEGALAPFDGDESDGF